MNDFSREIGLGKSVVLVIFKATNNVAEYEALLYDLRLSKEVQVKKLLINSGS